MSFQKIVCPYFAPKIFRILLYLPMELSENYKILNGQIKIILIFNRYVNYKDFSLYNEGNFFVIFIKNTCIIYLFVV